MGGICFNTLNQKSIQSSFICGGFAGENKCAVRIKNKGIKKAECQTLLNSIFNNLTTINSIH